MIEKQDIDSRDKDGHAHGYQEWYEKTRIWVRGNYKHGIPIGYEENHGITLNPDHNYTETNFYII